jgi:hypothetical protein
MNLNDFVERKDREGRAYSPEVRPMRRMMMRCEDVMVPV